MSSARDATPWLSLRILGIGNLLGALVSFFYFRFVDSTAAELPRVGPFEIGYSILAFSFLVSIGYLLGRRWTAPLIRWQRGADLQADSVETVRRRALQFPYALAGISVLGWLVAGVLWGAVWPLLSGTFSPHRMLRSMFGNTVIAGGVTCTFIFFTVEHIWRRRIPVFFPEGDLSAVRNAPRFPVRARLLAIFFLVSVVPLTLLAVLSYTRALSLVGADAATAENAVDGLRLIILFIVAVGIVAAVGLSIFAANSVAAPLKDVENAMAEVERGRLDGHAPVVSTDEIGAVAEGFNRMLQGLRDRERVKETFGKYVTPEIRDEILAGRISGEGELKEVTVLFADIRDFTPWVEATAPRDVVRDLNEYFTLMAEAIRGHQGLVLQFIGDEIEAVFGAPISARDHAARAVRAALDMRGRLRAWNARREAAGKLPLRHGIGIHTGTVLAGNIGGAERLSYALVGDPVNLASRIQGLTKEFKADILISEATRERLDGGVPVEELPAVRVKGRAEDVCVYKVV
ncbi:MAG TPA: adenylate/guanylate cyclase domain-containing protein [Methylomirabilota bacterium]|nr:adenylate/guanylate cyclase domain-containing protein [Methylomirabilota bacterium]